MLTNCHHRQLPPHSFTADEVLTLFLLEYNPIYLRLFRHILLIEYMIVKEEKKKITHRYLLPLSISCCYPKRKKKKRNTSTHTQMNTRGLITGRRRRRDDNKGRKRRKKRKKCNYSSELVFFIHRRLL